MSKSEIKNYRPISIISAVSKVFEIVLFDRIYDEVKNSISMQQHGFLPQKSTLTNLITFVQYLHEAFNRKSQVDAIFTDMEKAFDRVKHSVIIRSLRKLNVSGPLVKLITSYLQGRLQYVEIKGAKSQTYCSTSGVPQGSNLGPLLFICSINGICDAVKISNSLIFADDFKLFLEIRDGTDCMSLQEDLDGVCDWCSENGFNINPEKCASMSFSLKKNIIEHEYRLNNIVIRKVDVQKDLGVLIDDHLGFNEHISAKINEAHKIMGFIVRSCKKFNVDVCLKLFDGLVLPKLEYCCLIWSPQYEVWVKSIERVQRKFLKYMFFKKFGYYPHQGFDHFRLLAIFGRLSLENRRIKSFLIYLYKILSNRISDPGIIGLLPFSIGVGNTRNKKTFYLNVPRTNLYKDSPLYKMCTFFNVYASDIDIDTTSLRQYKAYIHHKLMWAQTANV